MIFTDNLTAISNAQNGQAGVLLSDIVLIANILKSGEIDTTVVGDFNTYIEVNGLIDTSKFIGRYVVVGREIVKITSVTQLTTTSRIYVDRAQLGTINSYAVKDDGIDFEINPNYSFRTATIFEGVKSFDINSNTGNNSEIFSFQVESSSVVVSIDPTEMKDWNQSLTTRKYNTKPTKTVIYLFRGLNVGEGSRMLTYTGFLKRAYPSAKRGESIVTLDIKDKFVKWNTKEMDKSFEIKNATPKTFFNAVLDIHQDMVIYGGGLSEENFRLVSGIYTKEFSTYNELLDAYCKQGVRFCFDELERVKVFCDFDGLSVQPDLEIPINETNITDISLDPNNQLIRNFITSNYKERKPMFDFENDLDGKYKKFNYSKAISNYQLVSTNNEFNVLAITETSADENSVFKRTLISDYVLLKDNLNNLQFYGRVLNKIVDGANLTSEILMGRFDKDYVLNVYGKYGYLTNLGYNLPRNFTVHYGIVELPLIFQLAFDNISGETVTSNMQIALLPQIQGDTTEYVKTFECDFGSADDLEIGTYSGYFEQISQAFGTWDNTKLFYNRELDQFNGTNPPLAVLSNRATKDRTTNTDNILTYTTFDNSNLALQVLSSDKSDMALRFKNTLTIPSSELHIDTPTEWLSSTLIKVDSLTPYKVGDVLTINKPNTWTNVAQQNNYADVSGIRYVIDGIVDEGVGQKYLILNNGYPYSSTYPMFSFTRYKYEHIVYLQEMYMRGNPVIELDSTILEKNATSIAEFEKQNYEIDGRFYDRFGLTDFIDYMIRGYAGVEEDRSDFKQILPFKCRDYYQIQRGDIIKLKDDIYTGTSSDDLFYVLGVQHIARSSEMNVWVINVNKFNADGSRYTLDEKLSYRPIETTYYSYTDSNSDVGSAYIVSTDSVMGALSLNRISRSDMRADILEIADNKITFNNFSGNNLTTYKDTIFSTTEKTEFVALIGNEYVYMKSYDNGDTSGNTESAVIVHRGLFSSTEETITATSTITFYSIIAGTSTEGVMASTSAFIGTDSDYLKFKPAIGLEVKTSGEVDISNDNNRMYFDPSNVDNKSQILLGVDWKGKPELETVEFQVGEETDGYLRYSSENGLEMNVNNLSIKGKDILNVSTIVQGAQSYNISYNIEDIVTIMSNPFQFSYIDEYDTQPQKLITLSYFSENVKSWYQVLYIVKHPNNDSYIFLYKKNTSYPGGPYDIKIVVLRKLNNIWNWSNHTILFSSPTPKEFNNGYIYYDGLKYILFVRDSVDFQTRVYTFDYVGYVISNVILKYTIPYNFIGRIVPKGGYIYFLSEEFQVIGTVFYEANKVKKINMLNGIVDSITTFGNYTSVDIINNTIILASDNPYLEYLDENDSRSILLSFSDDENKKEIRSSGFYVGNYIYVLSNRYLYIVDYSSLTYNRIVLTKPFSLNTRKYISSEIIRIEDKNIIYISPDYTLNSIISYSYGSNIK